ncbi:phosphoribosylglycinamide formyltransferase [Sphingomonas sp. CFBP 8760]|uniref:phosphoribosylglycinamide formyltransferase n=1 Tax=Sphingomonas sp. CFBP 8760 TaxID=2775282 RepID=UPI0017877663|nr:phosphoribosylglycinamide formyltransferase [Sphingomonas sp. CFBP 8760]MBD8547348.1 phosphoribosylglycinamide formyltransferase [Sphingomonas sp. CFBP 8760]
MSNEQAVAILISGRGSNMISLIEQARGYRVALVASDKPEAAGLVWAAAHGLATWSLSPKGIGKAAYEARLDAALHAAGVGTIALAGYMRLLSDDFVARWRGRIVNIHPSLLPLYKGLDTHARAIAAGDAEAGCSVHVVTEELDGGKVLGQSRVPILPDDDADELAARVLAAEHALYPRILSEFVMTPFDRVRDVALTLPETEELIGKSVFTVAGEAFVKFDGDATMTVRRVRDGADGSTTWISIDLTGDIDWISVEDRIARSWELTAPAHLLEAGGR